MHKAQIKISLHENKSTAAKNQEDRTGRGNSRAFSPLRDIFIIKSEGAATIWLKAPAAAEHHE